LALLRFCSNRCVNCPLCDFVGSSHKPLLWKVNSDLGDGAVRRLNTGVSDVSRALRNFAYAVLPDARSPAPSGHTFELHPLCPYISLEAINLSKFTRIVSNVERFPLIRKRDEWALVSSSGAATSRSLTPLFWRGQARDDRICFRRCSS
jgi:hypothetical protein